MTARSGSTPAPRLGIFRLCGCVLVLGGCVKVGIVGDPPVEPGSGGQLATDGGAARNGDDGSPASGGAGSVDDDDDVDDDDVDDDDADDDDADDDDRESTGAAAACDPTDDDCLTCNNDGECPDELPLCKDGRCGDCREDSDCAVGQGCEDGRCGSDDD